MYIPPYESLLKALKLANSEVDGDGKVSIPASLFKMLLQMTVAQSDFDEESYLRDNPDVESAIQRGEIESGRVHFIGFGYFEGRQVSFPSVDDKWYLKKYPDVAQAVKDGRVKSAQHHFRSIGGGEGRSPNSDLEDEAMQWKKVLGV